MEQSTTPGLANPKYGYIKKSKPKKEKTLIVEERTKPEILNNKTNPVYFGTLSTGLGINHTIESAYINGNDMQKISR